MFFRIAADAVVVVHFAFVGYVVLGGLLVAKWPITAWAHIPSAAYGAAIEFIGWTCPLTPIENRLRLLAGQGGYDGGFVEHYLLPILYPAGLSPAVQTALGVVVLAVNAVIYAFILWRWRQRRALVQRATSSARDTASSPR